jgi:cell fate (sporulation/competence/biofilm development) regulator YmcA (YheA/YmcA/DUF963 family)
MREELNYKIDELINILDDDSRIKEISLLKEKLTNDSVFLDKINKLKTLDIYSNEYKELKKEMFLNEDFVSFKELENEINFLILEINNRLRTLTNERRCNHENN